MIHFIYCYFLFGAFWAGRMWEEGGWQYGAFCVAFGAPLAAWAHLQIAAAKLDKAFQFRFFFAFVFWGAYKNCDRRLLAKMNTLALQYGATNSISDRVWRYGLKLINRRNNYTHPTSKP